MDRCRAASNVLRGLTGGDPFVVASLRRRLLDRVAQINQIRQSMRVTGPNGTHLGHVRDVNGQSILVQELLGRRVFWLSASDVNEVGRDEICVGAARFAQSPLADLPRA